jgi:hypothetical protein
MNIDRKVVEQEPVAWRSWNDHDGYGFWETKQEAEPWCAPDFFAEPIYTNPSKREWVGLTDEEIERACVPLGAAMLSFTEVARSIEAKLKEKNT